MSFNIDSAKNVPVFNYVPKEPGIIEKHVSWLREEREGIKKVAVVALIIFEVAFLTYSLIGLPLLFQALHLNNRMKAVDNFNEWVKDKQAPPKDFEVEMKTQTTAFNHVKEFVIQDGVIWHRLRGSDDEWSPLYFDGFIKGEEPSQIDCDGANLIVLDQFENVHYKKILKEFRKEEIDLETNRHLKDKMSEEEITHCAIDKSEKNNWKAKWFTAPYIHTIAPLFISKRLKLPEGSRAISISHRGRYNDHLNDAVGRKHPVEEGVTTLYILTPDGKDIRKFDPWSPNYVDVRIPLPESENSSFEAINMHSSASTLMVVGYETTKEGGKSKLKILTKLADIDSEGWNPFLKYDYWQSTLDKELRIIPIEPEWKEHPLPEDAHITKSITIQQTGEGNRSRELRIVGNNKEGQAGYWWEEYFRG